MHAFDVLFGVLFGNILLSHTKEVFITKRKSYLTFPIQLQQPGCVQVD